MKALLKGLQIIVLLGVVGAVSYVLYTQAVPLFTPPCTTPITYSVGTYDARFGISESQFSVALAHAASVWNTELGRTLIQTAPPGETGISANLVYSDVQKATELGKNIDAEQQAYNEKKAEVNRIKDSFSQAKELYEQKAKAYDRSVQAYQKDVDYWNAQGGAPPAEYQKLKNKASALEEERRALNREAEAVNTLAGKINIAVDQLNALAQKINSKVNTYNTNAGEDFDQGDYEEDADGKRINVYEFKNTTDLERVLVHEFGHALGLGHVANPDSVMYSFNIGEGLALTDEDKAELAQVCELEK